jgi:uncharacterized protein (TIGR03067 family)
MRCQLLGFLGLLSLVTLPSPAAEEDKADKDKLQGTWILTSVKIGGEAMPLPTSVVTTYTFKGDTFTVKISNLDIEVSGVMGTFKLGEKNELDLTAAKDSKPREGVIGRKLYKIDGETLLIAGLMSDSTTRPKSFDDKGLVVLSFKKK